MSNRVHVLINGEQFGPYPETEFRQHVADKKILRSDLAWREGMPEWAEVSAFLLQLDGDRPAVIAVSSPKAVAPVPAATTIPIVLSGAPWSPTSVTSPPSAAQSPSAPVSLREAAARGDVEAQFQFSLRLFEGDGMAPDETEGLRWLRLAAEAGHGEAQYTLGFRHANGRGVAQSDAEAVSWFRRAAEKNHAVAQCSLGYMLDHGRGAASNPAEAARWYRLAADRGDAVAQNNLAMLLVTGLGLPRNDAEAAKWFAKAAQQNVAGAQVNLGLLLAKGQGVTQDYVEAYKWFNLAAAQGHAQAVKNRELAAGEMTREQIAEAQSRAARFAVHREPGLVGHRPGSGGAIESR